MLKKKYRVQWSRLGRNDWNKIGDDCDIHSDAMVFMGKASESMMADWKIEEIFVKEQPKDML